MESLKNNTNSSTIKQLLSQLESNLTSTYNLIHQASLQVNQLTRDITFLEETFHFQEYQDDQIPISENMCGHDAPLRKDLQNLDQQDCRLQEGDKVAWLVGEERVELGTVRWIGLMHDGLVAGVEFEDPVGNSDGHLDGKKLFTCRNGHGRFVLVRELLLASDFFVE